MCPHMASSSGCHRRRSFFTAACLEVPGRAESVPRGLWWQSVVPSSPQSHLPPSCLVRSILPSGFPAPSLSDSSMGCPCPLPLHWCHSSCHLCTAFLGSLFFDSRLPAVQRQMFLLTPAGILAGSILDSPAQPREGLGENCLQAAEKNCLGFSRGKKKIEKNQ